MLSFVVFALQKVKQNMIGKGHLSRENLDSQFCSDWLKDQISKLLDRIDDLEARNKELKDKVKHLYGLVKSEIS